MLQSNLCILVQDDVGTTVWIKIIPELSDFPSILVGWVFRVKCFNRFVQMFWMPSVSLTAPITNHFFLYSMMMNAASIATITAAATHAATVTDTSSSS